VKEYLDGKRQRELMKQAEEELDSQVYTFRPSLKAAQLTHRQGRVEDRLLQMAKQSKSKSPIPEEDEPKPSFINKKSREILQNSLRSDPFASMKTLKTF
jgi:hypothetical protein